MNPQKEMFNTMTEGLLALPSAKNFRITDDPSDVPCLHAGPYKICFSQGTYDVWEDAELSESGLSVEQVEQILLFVRYL